MGCSPFAEPASLICGQADHVIVPKAKRPVVAATRSCRGDARHEERGADANVDDGSMLSRLVIFLGLSSFAVWSSVFSCLRSATDVRLLKARPRELRASRPCPC